LRGQRLEKLGTGNVILFKQSIYSEDYLVKSKTTAQLFGLILPECTWQRTDVATMPLLMEKEVSQSRKIYDLKTNELLLTEWNGVLETRLLPS
jgi:hypothetical protein